MLDVFAVDLIGSTQEERLPGYSFDFPYIATRSCLSEHPRQFVPWHLHDAAEMIYLQKGTIDYCTPGGTVRVSEGDCVLVMPNTLHRTKWDNVLGKVQMNHLFDPSLLFGPPSTRMAMKYVRPLAKAGARHAFVLRGSEPENRDAIESIVSAFEIPTDSFEYEIRLREKLTDAWLAFVRLYGSEEALLPETEKDEDIRSMLRYIEENCDKPISVEDVANVVHRSVRACYRLFRERLQTTPTEYLTNCRVRMACRLLTETALSVTQVAYRCGFTSASYFAKVFREMTGCTAKDFRAMAQNRQHLTKNE